MIGTIIADYNCPKHQASILYLLNQYAQDPMGGEQPLSQFVWDNLIEQLKNTPNAFSVLSYYQQQAVGLANCFQGFSTFAAKPLINIHDLAVSKDFRRQGIAHKILSKIEEVAKQRNCCKITLEVLSKNNLARKSYQQFGFKAYALDLEKGNAEFWQKYIEEN